VAALVVIDTDILIDASRDVNEALNCLDQIARGAALAVSVITEMELIVGCRNKTELRRFLNRFRVLSLSERISDVAAGLLRRYRLSHGLLIADALIAATAIVVDSPLVSKNQGDYLFIADLTLLPYPNPFSVAGD